MNPTARWLARGVWRFAATVVLTLFAFWVIGWIVSAVFGVGDSSGVYP